MRITRYACVLHGMAWVRLDKDAPFGVSWVAATDGEWVRYEEHQACVTELLGALGGGVLGLARIGVVSIDAPHRQIADEQITRLERALAAAGTKENDHE